MRENKIKKKLKNGGYVIGTFVKINDPLVVEVLGLSGFDFFVLDNEHVAMNRESMVNIIRSADISGIVPIIRVRENRQVEILQALDAGALGVQAPNIDTKEDAQVLVESSKYSPIGKRGFSPSVRAASYGMADKKEYIKQSNDNTLVVAHCESVTCMNNLDEILKLDEIDVIFIGPMDLSQSLGVIGEGNHPKVLSSIDTIIKKVIAANKVVGIVSPNSEKTKEYIERGVRYILLGSDQGMIASTGQKYLNEIKGI